jgi:hypothetical protein
VWHTGLNFFLFFLAMRVCFVIQEAMDEVVVEEEEGRRRWRWWRRWRWRWREWPLLVGVLQNL